MLFVTKNAADKFVRVVWRCARERVITQLTVGNKL